MKPSGDIERIVVSPVATWRETIRENEELVARLRAHNAVVLPDGVLAVEATELYRVSLLLREHDLTWHFEPFSSIEGALKEGDPVTLMNRILYDPRHAYSWLKRREPEWYPEAEDIEDMEDREAKQQTDYASQDLVMHSAKELDRGWQDPELTGDGLVTEEDEETQSGIKSTDPGFNPCPAYIDGFCRVDGRVCLYNKETFRDCPKYSAALSMEPKNLVIPPGTEDDEEYGRGKMGDA